MTPNGVEYIRTFPAQFDEDTENKFMRKVIDEYALEKKNSKGEPSGVFVMDKKSTKALGQDVIKAVKKLDDKQIGSYMNQYFSRTWEHFDVNETGKLEALDMTAFCKYLISDQSVDLDDVMK